MSTSHSQDSVPTLTEADKAVLFDELLRQMRRDNVTLLWGNRISLSCAELVAGLQEAVAERLARAADAAEAAGGNAVQAYQFEAIAYAATRSEAARVDALSSALDPQCSSFGRFTELAAQFAAFGITGLEEVYATEDDEQGDEDVKMFVCVRVCGNLTVALEENEAPPAALAELLAELAQAVCQTPEGEDLLQPADWELASIDELEGAPAAN